MGLKKLVKKAKKTVKKVVKAAATPYVMAAQGGKALLKGDIKGAANAAILGGTAQVGGILGATAANKYNDAMNAPLPEVNINQDIRAKQDSLIGNQLKNYQDFDLDNYVRGEADLYRNRLAQTVANQQKQVAGGANSRGMLFSGQRMKAQGDVAQGAERDYQAYGNNLIQDALQKRMQMAADPLMAKANIGIANQKQAQGLQDIRNRQSQAQGQLMQAGMGAIGEGMGTGLHNYQTYGTFKGKA